MANKHKFTADEVEEAIYEAGGVLTDVADALRCSHRTVCRYVHEYFPGQLEPAVADAESLLIDEAKQTIREAIKDGDWKAAKYLLNSRAGWAETQKLDVTSDGESINGFMSREAAREVLRRMAASNDD